MTLGEKMRAARLEKGMTQEQLAKLLGMTKQAIQRYEKDKTKNIDINVRYSIADILNMPYADVLQETEYSCMLDSLKNMQEDCIVMLRKSNLPEDVFTILFRLEEKENIENFIILHKSQFTPESFTQLKQFIEIMKIKKPDIEDINRPMRKITIEEPKEE